MAKGQRNRYEQVLIHVFNEHFKAGDVEVAFARQELLDACEELGLTTISNIGDAIYSLRYRNDFPHEIASRAPEGMIWQLITVSRSNYVFRATVDIPLEPRPQLAVVKVPDATPGIIVEHTMSSEQALLAKVRYNRLIDVFTGIVCYSLQSHVKTTIRKGVQIETDEIYLGVDRRGIQYAIPVEAKGGTDRLSTVQMNQDLALAQEKFPSLAVRLVGVQFTGNGDIYMFLFGPNATGGEVELLDEMRFRLVQPQDISAADLEAYRSNLGLPD